MPITGLTKYHKISHGMTQFLDGKKRDRFRKQARQLYEEAESPTYFICQSYP